MSDDVREQIYVGNVRSLSATFFTDAALFYVKSNYGTCIVKELLRRL